MAADGRVKTFAVDFDGVIHAYDGWRDGSIYGPWIPGAREALAALMAEHAVYVHTARSPRQVARWIEQTTGYALECTTWCPPWRRFWTVRGALLVTRLKLPAVAYLDDRAVRFTTWPQALADLGVTAAGAEGSQGSQGSPG